MRSPALGRPGHRPEPGGTRWTRGSHRPYAWSPGLPGPASKRRRSPDPSYAVAARATAATIARNRCACSCDPQQPVPDVRNGRPSDAATAPNNGSARKVSSGRRLSAAVNLEGGPRLVREQRGQLALARPSATPHRRCPAPAVLSRSLWPRARRPGPSPSARLPQRRHGARSTLDSGPMPPRSTPEVDHLDRVRSGVGMSQGPPRHPWCRHDHQLQRVRHRHWVASRSSRSPCATFVPGPPGSQRRKVRWPDGWSPRAVGTAGPSAHRQRHDRLLAPCRRFSGLVVDDAPWAAVTPSVHLDTPLGGRWW